MHKTITLATLTLITALTQPTNATIDAHGKFSTESNGTFRIGNNGYGYYAIYNEHIKITYPNSSNLGSTTVGWKGGTGVLIVSGNQSLYESSGIDNGSIEGQGTTKILNGGTINLIQGFKNGKGYGSYPEDEGTGTLLIDGIGSKLTARAFIQGRSKSTNDNVTISNGGEMIISGIYYQGAEIGWGTTLITGTGSRLSTTKLQIWNKTIDVKNGGTLTVHDQIYNFSHNNNNAHITVDGLGSSISATIYYNGFSTGHNSTANTTLSNSAVFIRIRIIHQCL